MFKTHYAFGIAISLHEADLPQEIQISCDIPYIKDICADELKASRVSERPRQHKHVPAAVVRNWRPSIYLLRRY